jgi:RNA polymerase sigma-70 factor (ECF subfamily)
LRVPIGTAAWSVTRGSHPGEQGGAHAPGDTDEALATRAASGEEAAFTLLMQRHKGRLYRFIRRYVGHDDDAFDILQDSFIAAWKALTRFDPERPFAVWLRQIALNKCRDHARRGLLRAIVRYVSGGHDDAPAVARWANPEAALSIDETLRRLDAAIVSLPMSLREPLILRVFEGLSQREAAQMLGVSEKAVETRLYRAKCELATRIERAQLDSLIEDADP